MKTWETPEIKELGLNATKQGGKYSDKIDNVWTDYDKAPEGGDITHITYAS